MAFNNYGYTPQYGTGYGQQYAPAMYSKSENLNWIMVPTVADVEKVTVQPGGRAWIMVQNEAVFALRSADQMGLINTELYSFQKYTPRLEPDTRPEYVTHEQMQAAIEKALQGIKGGTVNEKPTSNRGRNQSE